MKKTEEITWFHSIKIADQITKGAKPYKVLQDEAELYFRNNLISGKQVLDIGAWDGFMSFEAERRGAKRVVATDHFCWSGKGWGTKDGFDYAHQELQSNVESIDVDVFSLDPNVLGTFDVVLFLGVLYHLTDPWGGLKKAADMTKDLLIVESATDMNHIEEPVMRYYLGRELANDSTNFWAPNELCLRNMLTEMGFLRIETLIFRSATGHAPRIIAHAWK